MNATVAIIVDPNFERGLDLQCLSFTVILLMDAADRGVNPLPWLRRSPEK